MKERPIIMTAESVRGTLEGRKTQTRRVVKPQPRSCDHAVFDKYAEENNQPFPVPTEWFALGDGTFACATCGNMAMSNMRCPYGQPGDRLWVRETCDYYGGDEHEPPAKRMTIYRADEGTTPHATGSWCSPLLMPRWASRITLEIIKVCVERVQDITNRDALAEGIPEIISKAGHAKTEYGVLWDKINAKRSGGKYAWARNPWVWCLSFKRIGER